MLMEELLLQLQLDRERYDRAVYAIRVRFGASSPSDDRSPAQLAALYTRSRVEAALSALTADERDVLEMIAALADDSSSSLLLDDALLKSNALFGEAGRCRAVIRSLEEQGLLFGVRAYWREKLVLPDEIRIPVIDRCARRLAERIEARAARDAVRNDGDHNSVIESCGLAIYHDLITLISYLAREGADVTQKGHIYRRTMKKITEQFRLPERFFPEPFGEYMPKHFYFLESFLKRSGLAQFEHTVVLNLPSLQQWLSLPYIEWARRLQRFYLTRVHAGPRIPVRFLHRVFYVLATNVADRKAEENRFWWDKKAVWQLIAEKTERWGILLREDQLEEVCYSPFYLLGMLEWSKDEQGAMRWRWTGFGTRFAKAELVEHAEADRDTKVFDSTEETGAANLNVNSGIYVQPNLEIIVPEIVPAAVRWGVEALAEPERFDAANTYRITRTSVRRALEAGWTRERIMEFLSGFSVVPISDNVRQTIEGWIGNFGKAELWDVLLVKMHDPSLAAKLRDDPRFHAWVVESLSETAFIIRRRDEVAFRDWMRLAGCDLPLKVRDPGDEDESGSAFDETGTAAAEKGVPTLKREHIQNLDAFSPVLVARSIVTSI